MNLGHSRSSKQHFLRWKMDFFFFFTILMMCFLVRRLVLLWNTLICIKKRCCGNSVAPTSVSSFPLKTECKSHHNLHTDQSLPAEATDNKPRAENPLILQYTWPSASFAFTIMATQHFFDPMYVIKSCTVNVWRFACATWVAALR